MGLTTRRCYRGRRSGCGVIALGLVAVAMCGALPAHADPDTDFANQLHSYGIYGPRDYNAWLAKIVCWQFLAGAVDTYCPQEQGALTAMASASH
jgi:hypothetical protein